MALELTMLDSDEAWDIVPRGLSLVPKELTFHLRADKGMIGGILPV